MSHRELTGDKGLIYTKYEELTELNNIIRGLLTETEILKPGTRTYTWQRLEPHSRNSEIDQGVRAVIHDPTWLISLQWMMAEFEGEDAGSAVYVKVTEKHDSIKKIRINNKEIDYSPEYPLEALIERTNPNITTFDENNKKVTSKIDLQLRLKMSNRFVDALYYYIQEGTTDIDSTDLDAFVNSMSQDDLFKFVLNPTEKEFEPSITSDFVLLLRNRAIDVYNLIEEGLSDEGIVNKFKSVIQSHFDNLDAGDEIIIELASNCFDAFMEVKSWWFGLSINEDGSKDNFLELPSEETIETWDPSTLEYNFHLRIGDVENKNLELSANNYREDTLNWFSFEINTKSKDYKIPTNREQVLVPRNLRIPGQPDKRYWNFEDGLINFGNVKANITDISTLLLLQFSYISSADWYIIPFSMKIGDFSEIQKLEVIDTFGDKTEIDPAGMTETEINMIDDSLKWDTWNPFTLSFQSINNNVVEKSSYLFLPPVLTYLEMSPYHEEIKFLRDENANMSWAVEKSYRTLFGDSVDGYNHYQQQLRKILENYEKAVPLKNAIPFTFMTDVPWNWIPFIPVHLKGAGNVSQIALQRGALINKYMEDKVNLPHSRLLNEVDSPYLIEESVIPRSGIFYSERYQRTVWKNGRSYLWIGRKKSIGTGEGYSGLRFDSTPSFAEEKKTTSI